MIPRMRSALLNVDTSRQENACSTSLDFPLRCLSAPSPIDIGVPRLFSRPSVSYGPSTIALDKLLQDVVAISARPYGQRAVLKFAQYTGCLSIAGRFTPGTFTNQITKQFREPRLLIITDPRPDAQVGADIQSRCFKYQSWWW